jgi:hypothetical protein
MFLRNVQTRTTHIAVDLTIIKSKL